MSAASPSRSLTLADLDTRHRRGEKLTMLTCYDASFAARCASAGVEMLLVGDSLGMVIQGHASTLPVTLEEMTYHVAAVARGAAPAFVIADMPFGTYQAGREAAFANAARLLAAGAQMVKLEGGEVVRDTVRYLVERGIPVCGHLGLTPQSVHRLGGFRVQGRTEASAEALLEGAKRLAEAGASMIVLEAIPRTLAARVTAALDIPTIGIGAGPDCGGQVLVLYDMLGIYPAPPPRFVRNFLEGAGTIDEALATYVRAVKAGHFPADAHAFT